IRGLGSGPVATVAEAIADASHHTQPPAGLAVDYGFSLLNLGLAAFLVWLRPRHHAALLLAIGMAGTAAVFNLQAFGVEEQLPPNRLAEWGTSAFHLVAAVSYVLALLLFPDGKPVPRWSWPRFTLLFVPVTVAAWMLAANLSSTSRILALITVFGLITPAVGVLAQAYRYGRSQSAVERRQSRLLFWALMPALLLGAFVLIRGVGHPAAAFAGRDIDIIPVGQFRLFQPIFAIIPVGLFLGILRFKLWDIDRVITRALVYGLLVGFISVVYVVVVVAFGRAIGARGDNPLLALVATGVVAVAFEPVKARVERLANRLVYGRRATPYEVLATFSEGMAETVATEEKLSHMARLLAEGTAARRADVWLVVGGEARPAASWPDISERVSGPVRLINGELPALGEPTATVPVRHEGELLGALTVTKSGAEQLDPTEEKLLADLAAQAGLVLRNVRLTAELLDRLEELRASRQRLVAAQDNERRKIERDLHDGAQQQLIALKLKLNLARTLAERAEEAKLTQLLTQLVDDSDDAVQTLRELAHGIYPPLLAAEGLPAALTSQARKAAIPVTVHADGVGRYPQELEAAVYFCVLEALQNIAKYACAAAATVAVRQRDGALDFEVVDDGQGFDPACVTRGHGLTNMADRLDALGGNLVIDSAPGKGTRLAGSVPVSVAEPAR
ncbi:MAG: histidine kinase, partial [Actinomycetota bacterium]|nr:histidine kinase [Actinomycetota bacterium]